MLLSPALAGVDLPVYSSTFAWRPCRGAHLGRQDVPFITSFLQIPDQPREAWHQTMRQPSVLSAALRFNGREMQLRNVQACAVGADSRRRCCRCSLSIDLSV